MPGSPPIRVARCRPGLPTVATLMCSWRFLRDRVEAEEREEQVGLDALDAGAVGHDQAGVDPLQGALRDDDRDLLDRAGSWRSSSFGSSVMACRLDAAAGLGDAGDLGGELGRALGEQLVELLDGTPDALPSDADAGPVPLAWYRSRMNRMTCQCRSVSSSMPSALAICAAISSVHWRRVGEEALVVDGRRCGRRRSRWAWSVPPGLSSVPLVRGGSRARLLSRAVAWRS